MTLIPTADASRSAWKRRSVANNDPERKYDEKHLSFSQHGYFNVFRIKMRVIILHVLFDK